MVGPWLHHLDAHLKHWIWLILAVVVVVAAHWWLRRRESKKKDYSGARGRTVVSGYFTRLVVAAAEGRGKLEYWRQSTGRAGAMR